MRAGAREEGAKTLTLSFFCIAIAVIGICVALLGCAAARGCIAIGSECDLRDRLISRGRSGDGEKAKEETKRERQR